MSSHQIEKLEVELFESIPTLWHRHHHPHHIDRTDDKTMDCYVNFFSADGNPLSLTSHPPQLSPPRL